MNEMIAIVQCYIHVMTDKQVNIDIVNGHDLLLLKKAYNISLNWLQENKVNA